VTKHHKPSVLFLSHGLSWLASQKDCKPAVWNLKPPLGDLHEP